jgi:hypothetical protein
VIVIAYVPAGVELEVPIVNVDDAPDVTDVGENAAVAPDGSPLALNDTVSAEPDVTAVETVELVPFPATMLAELGLSETEKSLAVALRTVSVSVAVCDPVVPVAVIVIVYVPVGVTVEVPRVNVDDEPDVIVDGEKDAVAPDGSPLALSDSDSALPDVIVVDTVAVVRAPGATVADVGVTATEKSLLVATGPNAATPFGVPRPVGPS